MNRQVRQWLAEVANQRLHRDTRERPLERFKPEALRPLPVIPYDYRDSSEALVHKDLRLPFDGNRHFVPHRYVGRRLTIKADSGSVTIYDRFEEIVSYARSWRRGQTFGAARFEKLLAEHPASAAPISTIGIVGINGHAGGLRLSIRPCEILLTKGAPEEMFLQCSHFELDGKVSPMEPSLIVGLHQEYESLSNDGFRVLAVATKEMPGKHACARDDERELVLRGYVAFLDPPKPTARLAIEALKSMVWP